MCINKAELALLLLKYLQCFSFHLGVFFSAYISEFQLKHYLIEYFRHTGLVKNSMFLIHPFYKKQHTKNLYFYLCINKAELALLLLKYLQCFSFILFIESHPFSLSFIPLASLSISPQSLHFLFLSPFPPNLDSRIQHYVLPCLIECSYQRPKVWQRAFRLTNTNTNYKMKTNFVKRVDEDCVEEGLLGRRRSSLRRAGCHCWWGVARWCRSHMWAKNLQNVHYWHHVLSCWYNTKRAMILNIIFIFA